MPNFPHLSLFLTAAVLLAVTPGPGLFYVLARSLAGGRREGCLSSLGTCVGGLVHVFAAAIGLSALLRTSALAFGIVKYAGAAYLVYLGVKMILSHHHIETSPGDSRDKKRAFMQGISTEILNPKTALFFLAFIPQFVNPSQGHVFAQFAVLGVISVALNTSADLTVANCAGWISDKLKRNPRAQSNQRLASGLGMISLGVFVAVSGDARSD